MFGINAGIISKTKLNTTKTWNSRTLIDSDISYNEFALVNNVFKEYNDIKEVIKNPDNR